MPLKVGFKKDCEENITHRSEHKRVQWTSLCRPGSASPGKLPRLLACRQNYFKLHSGEVEGSDFRGLSLLPCYARPIPSLSHCSHLLSPSLSLHYSPHSQSPPSLGRICAMYLRPTFSFWRASGMLHKLLVFYLFPHFSVHPAFTPSGTGNN